MFHLVRKHCFVLTIVVLLWQGWARTHAAEPPSTQGSESLPAPQLIAAEDVPVRGAASLDADMKDPFFLVELLKQRAALEAEQKEGYYPAAGTQPPNGVDVNAGPGIPALRVTLQSTFPGNPGRAWINGVDLQVGDVVPGADEEVPPVLLEVGGTSVVLHWRGRRFRIDLDGTAPVEEEVQ